MRTAIPITAIVLLISLALYWVFAGGSAQAPRSDRDQRPSFRELARWGFARAQ